MASDAEIDLVVNASNALSDANRQLDNLVRRMEEEADPFRLSLLLDQHDFLARQIPDLERNLREAENNLPPITVDVDVDDEDANRQLNDTDDNVNRLGQSVLRVLGPLGSMAGSLGAAGLAAGSAAPLLAAVVTSVESIIPAAALATTGLLAIKTASATLKIGLSGVNTAIEEIFSLDSDPAKIAEAMEKLAPAAKSFVQELLDMKPAFDAIRLNVQNRLFNSLDEALRNVATETLPTLRNTLNDSADSFNNMAHGVANAVRDLEDGGALQTALSGVTSSFRNLERAPGQAAKAFGQLAAAAAPAFARISSAVGKVADSISESLTQAFESGELEQAIEDAIDVIAQLGRIAGNVFEGIGNIISGVSGQGEGLFSVMEKITQAFADVTATEGFQDALKALSETVGVLVDTALPILSQALQILGPVFEALAPPIQELIKALGAALGPILEALGPVLVSLAEAFGKLVIAALPIIELAGELIAALLPALIPLFDALGQIFEAITPFVQQLADNIATQLVPILGAIGPILAEILPPFVRLAESIFPLLTDILVQLQPSLELMATALADLLVQVAPLVGEILNLAVALFEQLMPFIQPLLELIIDLIELGMQALADIIHETVVPALQIITKLLQGDVEGAFQQFKDTAKEVGLNVVESFLDMKTRTQGFLRDVITAIGRFIEELPGKLVDGVRRNIDRVIEIFAELPDNIISQLASLPGTLLEIGRNIIQGLIDGVTSGIATLQSTIADIGNIVPDTISSILGIHSPSLVMDRIGGFIMDGLLRGLRGGVPALDKQIDDIARRIPLPALSSPTGSLGRRIPGGNRQGSQQINVFVGGQKLDSIIDNRITLSDAVNTRVLAQGVRR